MKNAIIITLSLLAILFAAAAEAAEGLRVFQSHGAIGIQTTELKLPTEILHKSAKSGLSTTFLAIVSVYAPDKLLHSQEWSIKYHYDLWDENFILQIKGPKKVLEMSFKNEAELFAGLAKLKLVGLWPPHQLGAQLQFKLQLILDPVDKEKAQQIRKWISQNILPQTTGNPNASSLLSNSTPLHFSGLFQKILNRDGNSNQTQGLWSTEAVSPLVQLKDIANEE